MMIYLEFNVSKTWTWKDLHKKIVKVIYHDGNTATLEPPMLMFFDVENKVSYIFPPEPTE